MEQFTKKATINQGGWKQFDDGSVIQDSLKVSSSHLVWTV